MLWSKQFFFYKVGRWLKQHGIQPYKANPRSLSIECPTGSGKQMNLHQVAKEIGAPPVEIFQKDAEGKRPVGPGMTRRFQEDPHWWDYPLFYEYFHGDTGAGVGASHQTGWSGAVARIAHLFASFSAHEVTRSEQRRIGEQEASTRDEEMTKSNTRVWKRLP